MKKTIATLMLACAGAAYWATYAVMAYFAFLRERRPLNPEPRTQNPEPSLCAE